MHGILKLEQHAHEKFTGDEYNINVVFGVGQNFNFTKNDQFFESFEKNWCTESQNCFQESLIDNVENMVLNTVNTNEACPEILVKKFILIASDICLKGLNIPLKDLDRCSKDYRNIALLLPSKKDVEHCENEILQSFDALHIQLYSSETISNNDILERHSDMNVLYQTTYAESTFNLLVMVNEFYSFAYYFFDPKLPNFAEFPLCRKGSISGFFQYISLNTPTQKVIKMTSPLDYKSNSAFPETYKNEVKKAKEEPFNCDFIKEFLITANSMPFNGSQYNMLLINDPYPSCLNFELLWNNTNRFLEIVVFNTKNIESNYSNFISPSNDSLSHLRFYKANEGLDQFWEDTSICKTKMLPKKITNNAELILPYEPTLNDPNNSNLILWLIIGGGTVAILATILIAILTISYFVKKRSAKKRMSIIRAHANSITSTTKIHSNFEQKYWNFLLDDTNVIIDYDNILGKGSKAIVYQAIIKKGNFFHVISATKVAAKISSSTDIKDIEETMNEINYLSAFENGHQNIIKLKGWFLNGGFPVILTEIAEMDLLKYVKSLQNPMEAQKSNTRIIWDLNRALKYLSEKNLIHRDIACRNVLITEKNVVKLADFALCCKCDSENGMYKDAVFEEPECNKHKRFPVKWLSIEALTHGIFSEKSDVWSFGILCWEVFSGGAEPYHSIPDKEIVKYLKYENRLEKPEYASNDLYELMANCWSKQARDRLTFNEIYDKLRYLLEYDYLPLKYENQV